MKTQELTHGELLTLVNDLPKTKGRVKRYGPFVRDGQQVEVTLWFKSDTRTSKIVVLMELARDGVPPISTVLAERIGFPQMPKYWVDQLPKYKSSDSIRADIRLVLESIQDQGSASEGGPGGGAL